jgi:hypothetical protein
MGSTPEFMIGSDEHMFDPFASIVDEAQLAQARLDRGIIPDFGRQVEGLFASEGYTQIREVAPGVAYPDADAWIDYRIAYRRGIKAYPCFVTTEAGETLFCKIQTTNDKTVRRSFEDEAVVLESLPPGLAPGLKADGRNKTGPMFIALEAIPFAEGRVGSASEWTTTHCVSAAKNIHELEAVPLDELSDTLHALPQFQQSIPVVQVIEERLQQAANVLPEGLAQAIRAHHGAFVPVDCFAHRDTGLKNIVLRRSGEISLLIGKWRDVALWARMRVSWLMQFVPIKKHIRYSSIPMCKMIHREKQEYMPV